MKKIGIVGSDNSHAITFTKCVNFPDKETGNFNFPDYRVTHIFGLDPARTEEVSKEVNIPNIVATPEEMIGEVDAVVVIFRHGDLHYEYALPFIKAGIPTWVDKPFTIKVPEAKSLVDIAKEHGTTLVGGSVVPALSDIQKVRQSIQDGSIGNVETGSVSYAFKLVNDYGGIVFYSPHVVEASMAIFGYDVKSVISTLTNNVLTAIAKYENFQITMNFIDFNKGIYVTAIGDKGGILQKVQGDTKLAGVTRFIDTIEGRIAPQRPEQLINPVIFLAAMEKSLNTGKEIYLTDME